MGGESWLVLQVFRHLLLKVLPNDFEHIWIEVRMDIFSEDLDWLLLNIRVLQKCWHSGLTMRHRDLESHVLGWCDQQLLIDGLAYVSLDWLC